MTNPIEFSKKLLLYLKGELSEHDKAKMQQLLEDNEEVRKLIQELNDKSSITKHIAHLQRFDIDAALQKVRSRQISVSKTKLFHIKPFRYAAVILSLIFIGTAWWYFQYTKVTPPEISESVQLAMQQSKESCKLSANVTDLSKELKVRSDESLGSEINQKSGIDDSTYSKLQTSLTKDQLLAAHRITTMHDKEFWITLEDGTLVHLNYNTHLIYPERFGRGDRNVILDGEAYFMVAKDKSRPFVVHTAQGDVKVYGTEFNVQSCKNSTTVVLVKGTVSVSINNGKKQMMIPNEFCQMTNNSFTIEKIDVQPYVAWHTGTFAFVNTTIENLVKVLSAWYNIEIILTDESVRTERFSGYLDRYLPQEQVLNAIEKSSNLTIYKKDERIYINR